MMRLFPLLLLCLGAPAQTRLWIDADTANEIDDLYAIARLLAAPEVEIVALSSAHWSRSPAAEGNTLAASQRLNEACPGSPEGSRSRIRAARPRASTGGEPTGRPTRRRPII